jgi:hypothetical protein
MAFSGGVVAVVVGGTAVGVSVGGRRVDVGDGTSVGGRLEGTLVPVTCVPAVAQPARDRMIKLNKSGKDIFLIMMSSFDQSAPIITRWLFVQR